MLGIARGLKGFVNFEAGLTRGNVPDVEHLEAQARQLGQARKRLMEQDQQLSALKAQLAQRDKRIEQLNRRLRGHSAGGDAGLQKEARLSSQPGDTTAPRNTIAEMRLRLHALGFVERALEDLQNLVAG